MAGFTAEVLQEAARRLNLQIQWVPSSARAAAPDNTVNLWPRLAPDDHSTGQLYFSAPWLNISYVLVSRRAESEREGTMRVAHVDSGYLQKLVKTHLPGVISVPLKSPGKLLPAVCSGEADAAFLESRVTYSLLINGKSGCDGQPLQMTPVHGAIMPASVASTKEAAWAADRIREEIGRMSEDGSLARLHAAWFLLTTSETGTIDSLLQARRNLRTFQAAAVLVAALVVGLLFAARRLRQAQRTAARANDAKTRFVASVCHELRTPLSGIVGIAEMLADSRLTPEQTESARLIRSSAKSLLQVINDILDVGKAEAGKMELSIAPFRPRALVDEVMALMAGRAGEKGLQLTQAVDESLPLRLTGDEQRIRQVLLNLIGNAVKFTDQGSIALNVQMAAQNGAEAHVRFSVTDTGAGIPASELRFIFDEFRQGGAGVSKGGTGLGLTISRRLVELMGGAIGVDSEWGRGSTFSFTVPMGVCANLTLTPVPVAIPPRAPGHKPMRVLVCEDSKVNQKALVHMLTRLNHRVDAVDTAHGALQALEQSNYDLVLMDYHLPDMTGLEATRLLRGQAGPSARIPVICLTASTSREDERLCLEGGMDAFLIKPLSLNSLADALNKFQPAGERTLTPKPINKLY